MHSTTSEPTVRVIYSATSCLSEARFFCPGESERKHLEIVPHELIEKGYRCGDASRNLCPVVVVHSKLALRALNKSCR